MKKFMSILLCFILCFNLMPVITLAGVTHTITLSDYDSTKGLIYLNGSSEGPNAECSYNEGDSIQIQVVVENGYQVSNLLIDDISVGALTDYTINSINENHTINVNFSPVTYTITASAGEGGSISPSGNISVEHGSSITFTVTPDALYVIQDVIIDGEFHEGAINTFEFTNIEGSRSIEAIFQQAPAEQYNMTLNYDGSKGVIRINDFPKPSGPLNSPFNNGDDASVEIEAGNGYKISSVSVGGVNHADFNENLYSFQLEVTGDTTISVEFEPAIYTITASAGENGTITPEGESSDIQYDSNLIYIIEPDNGYEIDQITVNDESIEINEFDRLRFTYEFHNINQDHTINATFRLIGDGSTHTLTVESDGNGIVKVDDVIGETFTVTDGFDVTLSIAPNPGYSLSTVIVDGEDQGWGIEYAGDGKFAFTVPRVMEDIEISVVFQAETLDGILSKSYAILDEEAGSEALIEAALIREFGLVQYVVDSERITASNIDLSGIETVGYGTFSFTVKVDEEVSTPQTGYIVPEFSDVIFKYDGSYNENPINEIRIAHTQDAENGMFSAPAMDSGTIDIFGLYNFHVEGWISNDTRDAFGESQNNKLVVVDSFYRVNLHLGNTATEQDKSLNLFGFNLIQDDAFCVKVDATSAEGTQRTLQWDLNRYAILNSGDYVSEVFFGNDTFEISIPEEGIGGITELSLETGDFQGYTVTETEPYSKFEVFFKSDFYDRITLDVTINGTEVRQLTVHRVGVQIQKEEYNPDRGSVVNLFHGTQYSTEIDFSDGQYYRVYATYCIPDGGTVAPYGLFVTYTWANGTKTSSMITAPCDAPSPAKTAEVYEDGVFIYGNGPNADAACCDYLIYSAQDGTNVPLKINVTVLKGNPLATGTFGGIFFGSGAGVEWKDEED